MSDCLILNVVSCATPQLSLAIHQMFTLTEALVNACAIHLDKLYGLSSYVTAAHHLPAVVTVVLGQIDFKRKILILVLKHAPCTVSRNNNI